MEWLARGRTIGKMAMGLRVVRDDGGPIGLRQALVRGLAGLVLEKPGLLFPLTTVAGVRHRQLQRPGEADRRHDGRHRRARRALRHAGRADAAAAWVDPPLQPWAAAVDLQRRRRPAGPAVRQFVVRAHEMSPAAQWSLGESLRAEVLPRGLAPAAVGAPTPVAARRRAGRAPPPRRLGRRRPSCRAATCAAATAPPPAAPAPAGTPFRPPG